MTFSRLAHRAAGALSVAAAGLMFSAAQAQDIKMYAFSSGALTLPKGILQNLASMDPVQVPVGFYLIRHPKGNVLFDTGNNDKLISDPNYWPPAHLAMKPVTTPDVAVDVQLKKVGVSLDDVNYVVLSHMHLDHGGNVARFPKATVIVQKDEVRNAFWPEHGTGGPYVLDDFLPLRKPFDNAGNAVNMIQLNGDHDIFGDGTMIVKRWVAHTPGSQMMTVKLKNTGLVILTGDNVYFRENVEKNLPPNLALAYFPTGFFSAYEFIRQQMAAQKADYFTAHDPDAYKAMKKAPEFYD
jgi:N-acyl homoserine lactone hydrolase